MSGPDAAISFAVDTAPVVRAAIAIAVAVAIVWLLKWALDRHGARVTEAIMRGELTPEADTRLRLLKRLLYSVVLFLGIAAALSQFKEVSSIGKTLLASSAIVAAIVGLAARQTLANSVAGIMIAITQPVRVGDWVKFDEDYGVVEDVTLNTTRVRTGNDQLVIIPNEKIATGVLRNDTMGSPTVGIDVSVWIPPHADAGRALEVLRDATGHDATIAEATPWGTRLALGGDPVAPPDKWRTETALRARAVARLREEGLLQAGPGA
jgi:small-conductance mechanosensitive channel